MLLTILVQEMRGVFILALPIVALAWVYPFFLQTLSGNLLCGLALSLYVFIKNYQPAKAQSAGFIYQPTGESKTKYDDAIKDCLVDPQLVRVRYGYSNQMIAMTLCDTIIIDPLYYKVIDDPEMQKVKAILDEHIVSKLPQNQRESIEKTKEFFTAGAQRFIFKHELGHVVDSTSLKRSLLLGIIIFITTIISLAVANALASYSIAMAAFMGFIIAVFLDLLLSYSFRALFNLRDEIKADAFASKYCTVDDIQAAADFFEKLQEIYDSSSYQLGILRYLPMSMVTGHYNGKDRAQSLRRLARQIAICRP